MMLIGGGIAREFGSQQLGALFIAAGVAALTIALLSTAAKRK